MPYRPKFPRPYPSPSRVSITTFCASFTFKAISSQSHFQLTTQGHVSGTRYDGTYQSPTATQPDAMSYLEWRMPDHQLRAVYVIAPTIALRNLVVDQIIQSYRV